MTGTLLGVGTLYLTKILICDWLGIPHLKEGDVPPQGGRPGWAAPPSPRMGPWLTLLKKIAQSFNLVPEFEVIYFQQFESIKI